VFILFYNDFDFDVMVSGLVLCNLLWRIKMTAIIGAVQGVMCLENLRMANIFDIYVEKVIFASFQEFDRIVIVDV